jgi:hypothetical protein
LNGHNQIPQCPPKGVGLPQYPILAFVNSRCAFPDI